MYISFSTWTPRLHSSNSGLGLDTIFSSFAVSISSGAIKQWCEPDSPGLRPVPASYRLGRYGDRE